MNNKVYNRVYVIQNESNDEIEKSIKIEKYLDFIHEKIETMTDDQLTELVNLSREEYDRRNRYNIYILFWGVGGYRTNIVKIKLDDSKKNDWIKKIESFLKNVEKFKSCDFFSQLNVTERFTDDLEDAYGRGFSEVEVFYIKLSELPMGSTMSNQQEIYNLLRSHIDI